MSQKYVHIHCSDPLLDYFNIYVNFFLCIHFENKHK